MAEYESIGAVEWVRDTEGGVLLRAHTPHTALNLSLGFYGPDVVRFRLWPDGYAAPYRPVRADLAPFPAQVTRAHGRIEIRTEALTCEIDLDPLCWQLRTAGGDVIWAQQRDDANVRGSSNVPALGLWRADGQIEQVVDSFVLEPEDRIYGFGEKFFAHDKRGHTLTAWNLDAWGVETERAYKNIPFCLSSRGVGLLVNSATRMVHAVGDPAISRASYVLTVEEPQLDYFVIAGPSFKHLLRRYADLTGYAPVPPQWAFGLWMSRCYFHNRAVAEEVAQRLRDLDIPCDVLVFDGYWVRDAHQCDLLWDEERFVNPREMLAGLHAQGFKSCVWEGPFVPSGTEMLEEGERGGYLLLNPDHETYLINTGLVLASHNREDFKGQETAGSFDGLPPAPPAALVDFTNPAAVRWFQAKHAALMDLGVDVFKTDFGEQVPEDAISSASGLSGVQLHNLYSVLYNQAVFEVTQRRPGGQGLVWARSASAGSQQYPVHWGGDPQSSYSSLAGSLRGGLSLGLSGIPFWGSDIGGFFGSQPTPRLYIRWAQFGLFSTVARCHGTTPREPWAYGDEAVDIFRRYAQLRYRLLPYLYSYAYVASQTGLPVMRPLLLEFQDDPAAQAVDSQYLLGEWLLVAPVLSARDERTIYLPRGLWRDFWTGTVYPGPQTMRYPAPLDVLPLFLRAGAILPLGPEVRYVGEKPFDPITLMIWPDDSRASTFEFQDDAERVTITCQPVNGGLALTVSGSAKSYRAQLLGVPRPWAVRAGGVELPLAAALDGTAPGWTWDAASGLSIQCPPAPFRITLDWPPL